MALKVRQASGLPELTIKIQRAALTTLQTNPDILKGNVNRPSVYTALIRCAQDGLLPDGREAAFVRFGTDVVYQPMIGGFRKRAAEHGFSLVAYVVYSEDDFDYGFGEKPFVNHRPPKLDLVRGEPIGAYAVATDKHGNRYLEVMSKQEIEEVRKSSRAASNGPWVTFWGEMARKTVARRLFKQLPLGAMDERTVGMLEADEIVFGPLGDLPHVDPAEEIVDVELAENGEPESFPIPEAART